MTNTWNGTWVPEKNYKNYPKEQWCDMDYIANYIMESNVKLVNPLQVVCEYIALDYTGFLSDNEIEYYAIAPEEGELMINIADLDAYVYDNGGIEIFDSESSMLTADAITQW